MVIFENKTKKSDTYPYCLPVLSMVANITQWRIYSGACASPTGLIENLVNIAKVAHFKAYAYNLEASRWWLTVHATSHYVSCRA